MGGTKIEKIESGAFSYSAKTLDRIVLLGNKKLTTFPFADLK
jgi:hypothetical protein